jgi:hypothetical protein
MRRREHAWRTTIYDERPGLIRDAYEAIARAFLAANQPNVEGLREILNDPKLELVRDDIVFGFLSDFPNASPFPLSDLLRSAIAATVRRPEFLARVREVLAMPAGVDPDRRELWLVAGYLVSPQEFETPLETYAGTSPGVVWVLREMTGYNRRESSLFPLSIGQLESIAKLAGSRFPDADPPEGGSSGDRNAWDAAELVRSLINKLSSLPDRSAGDALERLTANANLATYRDILLHATAGQRTLSREAEYQQPTWNEAAAALANGPPANVADLCALVVAQLADVQVHIATSNADIYKQFWNEMKFARLGTPKSKESCRDVLLSHLRPKLLPLGVTAEPEGHMLADRRADIACAMPGIKLVVELKKDTHPEVWTAAEMQLDRYYTRDPDAKGFGLYGVFWFGSSSMPAPPNGRPRPNSPGEMKAMLETLMPVALRTRIAVVVLDVSGPS